MAFRNSILAGEELVRSGIRSPNFDSGVAGWRIARNGDAEFNDVTVRGTFETSNTPGVSRIKISGTPLPEITLYTGSIHEEAPGLIFGQSLSDPLDDHGAITLVTPDFSNTHRPLRLDLIGPGDTFHGVHNNETWVVFSDLEHLILDHSGASADFRTGIDILGAWVAYVPVHAGIAKGNGTEVARYMKVGRTVHVEWALTLGTTSVMGANMGLPVAAQANTMATCSWWALDVSGPNQRYGGIGRVVTPTLLELSYGSSITGQLAPVAGAAPFPWAAGDVIQLGLTYQAAA